MKKKLFSWSEDSLDAYEKYLNLSYYFPLFYVFKKKPSSEIFTPLLD